MHIKIKEETQWICEHKNDDYDDDLSEKRLNHDKWTRDTIIRWMIEWMNRVYCATTRWKCYAKKT